MIVFNSLISFLYMDRSYSNSFAVFSPPSLNVSFDKNWVIFKETPDGSLSKILKPLSSNTKSLARSWFNMPFSTISESDVEPGYNSVHYLEPRVYSYSCCMKETENSCLREHPGLSLKYLKQCWQKQIPRKTSA